MVQITHRPHNVTVFLVFQFITVDVYQGTAIFKHILIPISVWAH